MRLDGEGFRDSFKERGGLDRGGDGLKNEQDSDLEP